MKKSLLLLALALPLSSQTPTTSKPAALPAPSELKYPPARPIPIPRLDTFTMPNGLKLHLLEDHELPFIAGTALVRTGSLFDPSGKAGLAELAGMVMGLDGTRTKTGEQLDAQLETWGASLECEILETYGTLTFSAPQENAVQLLTVLRDVLVSPEFRQDRIDLAKARMRNAIARRNDDPRQLAQRQFLEFVYDKSSPYGRRLDLATVNRIVRADLQSFHHRYFFPANVVLAVRGDFNSGEMKTRLESLFASWTEKQEPLPAFPKVTAAPAPGVYVADRKDTVNTFFSLGHLGGQIDEKDYAALRIAASVLGRGPASRLARRVRPKLAFEISAAWNAEFDHPGTFQIAGGVPPGSAADAIKATLEEIDRMRATGITDDELRLGRDAVLQEFVFSLDSRAKLLNRMLMLEYFGYPPDAIEQFPKSLAAVTRADVQRVVRDRLDPGRCTIVVVGNPVTFGEGFETLGRTVSGIDLTTAQPKMEITPSDENSLQKGKQILARAQQSMGGAEKLAAVKDTLLVTRFKLSPAAGGTLVNETDRWLAPSYFRQESQIGERGKIIAFYDGASGRISTPTGSGALTGAQLKQVRGDLFRHYIRLLLSDRIEGRVVNGVDEHTVEISDPTGEAVQMVLDLETGLPSRLLYLSQPTVGAQVSVEEVFSDFRDVGGIKIPFGGTILQNGQTFAEVTVIQFQANQGLKLEEMQTLQ